MKPILLIPSLFIFVFMTINYQAIFGLIGAQIEAWRLRENAAGMAVPDNPPDAADSFENGLSDMWETSVINGSGMVHPGPEFSSGKFELKDGSLFLHLRRDPDFENKPNSKRYNNVALIGFRGYSVLQNLLKSIHNRLMFGSCFVERCLKYRSYMLSTGVTFRRTSGSFLSET